MKVYQSVLELVGRTPLLQLHHWTEQEQTLAHIFVKIESFNPAGSIKDRVAKKMVEDAEVNGKLQKESVIIEPTSGNTGIGLALIAASKGYRLIITMPETMSEERKKLMRAYGAELVLTDGKKGMKGAIEKAESLLKEIPNSIILGQFTNPSNPEAHYQTTGPEIYEALEGKVDILVAGVGTGGTITGIGKFLKEKIPSIQIVAVEPASSPVLSQGKAGLHGIQGIGAGFVPSILDTKIYQEVIPIQDEDAFKTVKALASREGLLVGISSGAALFAATELAKKEENRNKNIVVILPDSGERYLSTTLFDN